MRGLYNNRLGDYRNLFSSEFVQNFPFSIEQVGTDYCSEEYYLSRENSPLSVVGYTFQGRGILDEDGKEYSLEENRFFILKSGHNHSYYPKKNWAFCWFNVMGDLESLLKLYGIDQDVIFYCPPMNAPFSDAVNYCVKAENGIYDAQLYGQSFILSLLPQLSYATRFDYDELKIELKLKILLENPVSRNMTFPKSVPNSESPNDTHNAFSKKNTGFRRTNMFCNFATGRPVRC